MELSKGCIAEMLRGVEVIEPIVQLIDFKTIKDISGATRTRLHISDGVTVTTLALLSKEHANIISEGEMDKKCVFKIDKYTRSTSEGRSLLILTKVTVIAKGEDVGCIIGAPVPATEASGSANNATTTMVAENDPSILMPPPPPPRLKTTAFQSERSYRPRGNASSAGISSTTSNLNPIPISGIKLFSGQRKIKGKIVYKSPIRTFQKPRGVGKVFDLKIVDGSGAIKMVGFNETVDIFYDKIEPNQVYTFSKFFIRPASAKYYSYGHSFELSLKKDSVVLAEPGESDQAAAAGTQYSFTELIVIPETPNDEIVDVIGVCKRADELMQLTKKRDGQKISKRTIILTDEGNVEIPVSLWGKLAEDFDEQDNPVIAFKSVRVGNYYGKNLSMTRESKMSSNPDLEEARRLRIWFDKDGRNLESKSLSLASMPGVGGTQIVQWKSLREVTALDPKSIRAGQTFKAKATIIQIKRENLFYKACVVCSKKVLDNGNGYFTCTKCGEDRQDFILRLTLHINFADSSGNLWATCFHETAEPLLNASAGQLELLQQNDTTQLEQILERQLFRNLFVTFRATLETFCDGTKIKYTVKEMSAIPYAEYAKFLLSSIKEEQEIE